MDSYKRLYAAIKKLSETQERRLSMYYFKGMTYRQIAKSEKIDFSTAARSVKRAICNLRDALAA
jgi:RNA polymerase sigma factor (sigma-70 family)